MMVTFIRNKLQNVLLFLIKTPYTVRVFILFFVLVILSSLIWQYIVNLNYPYYKKIFYDGDFWRSFLTNANSTILDFFVLGIVVIFFEKRNEEKLKRDGLLEDLKDYASYSEVKINLKKSGILKRLNQAGCYHLDMPRLIMNDSSLKDITFKSGDITASSFNTTKFQKVKLENLTMKSNNFNNSTLIGTIITNCDLYNLKMKDANAKGTDFRASLLTNAQFHNSNLQACDFRGCDFKDVSFEDSDLSRANFLNAKNLNLEELIKAKKIDYIYIEEQLRQEIMRRRPDSVHQRRSALGNRTP